MAIVRSFRHPIGNHEQAISHVLTGGTDPTGQAQDGYSMGSMYARLRGANHPTTGMPTYALLTAPAQGPAVQPRDAAASSPARGRARSGRRTTRSRRPAAARRWRT